MNELLNDIDKRLPYRESDEYLDSLIDSATEQAITHHAHRHSKWRMTMIKLSAAAVTLLAVGIGITLFNGHTTQPVTMDNQSPLDEFLNTLSDEEAAQLQYYEIEEIPEY